MGWYPVNPAAPSAEPITLTEAKSHLLVDDTSQDGLIGTYIKAARLHVEAYTGVTFGARDLSAYADAFTDLATLPFAPVSEVISLEYVDADGATQTVPATVYSLRDDNLSPSIVLASGQAWPSIKSGERIRLTASVGAVLPDDVRAAMLLLIGQWFETREGVVVGASVQAVPHAVDALLCNYRRFGG